MRPGIGAALLVAGVITLAGCGTVVGPDYRVPAQAVVRQPAASAAFASAAEAAFDARALPPQWWRLYQDPTLDGLVARAFAANTDLRVAAANLARLQALQVEAARLGRPDISVHAAPAYGRPSAAALGRDAPLPASWSQDTGVTMSYQLDLFGKIARTIEAAGADSAAAQAALDLARVTVAAETARAYVDACAAGQQILVARHSVALQQQFVKLTGQRIAAGRGNALDESRAQGQLDQLRAAVPPLLGQHRTAQFRLAVLTGDLPGTLSANIDECHIPPRLQQAIPVGDGAALLRRRPDIRQAERNLAATSARIGVATSALYPDIQLGLSGGSSGSLGQFGTASSLHWSLGPLISWTLPATGSARSRIAQAEAGNSAALARFDGTVLNALREVESALTVYARELDRNAALHDARDQGARASEQAATLFRHGRTDFLTTLDAERTLASAESQLASSDALLASEQVTLFLALGGGWENGTIP
jgi:multidrug efflux system outer membrane protein